MPKSLTKAFLENTYVAKRLSTWAIEKKYGYSRSRIYNALKQHSIPTRTLAASHIRYARKDFSNDPLEKAYLLGFAIGDLRVRLHNKKKSETISIGCGSTHLAQVRLIESLFSPYGRVWKGKRGSRGEVNVEAFVNHSFSFLLPENRTYGWTIERECLFFAFLGGFTDAEGGLFLTRNQARVAWGNYDTLVLAFIRTGIQKFGIEVSSLYCDTLQGRIDKEGYRRNKNYCHVVCARKSAITTLLDKLEPFLRHEEKLEQAKRLRKNIAMRSH